MKKKKLREQKEVLELDIVIYHRYIYEVGGIETWLYYIAKKYNIGQITILCNGADDKQIKRLSPEIDVVFYTGQEIHCNKIIFTMNHFIVPELYKSAEERYLMIHSNFSYSNYGLDIFEAPPMNKIYAVSDVAANAYRKLQEQEVFTLYNPVEVDKPKKLLKLISATRLTHEKGKERIIQLAKELDKAGIPFIWLIFTDRPIEEKVSKNFICMKPRYNMSDYIVEADYGVQLSSDESYCLFVQECLKLKVPVIVTDLPVFRELGITDKEAHILNLDMSNLDVEKIYKKIPKVNYKVKESDEEYRKLLEVDKDDKKTTRKTKKTSKQEETKENNKKDS